MRGGTLQSHKWFRIYGRFRIFSKFDPTFSNAILRWKVAILVTPCINESSSKLNSLSEKCYYNVRTFGVWALMWAVSAKMGVFTEFTSSLQNFWKLFLPHETIEAVHLL